MRPASSSTLSSSDSSACSTLSRAARSSRSTRRWIDALSWSRNSAWRLAGGRRFHLRGRLDTVDRELVDLLRLVDVLQLPLPQREDGDAFRQRRADERTRRLREEDVAALGRGADASGAHDVEAEVPLAAERRLARVEPHAHAHGRVVRPDGRRVGTLRFHRGLDRVACPREREEERVALRVDLDAVRAG